LAGEFADRDFTVTAGDCNDSIHGVLSDLSSVAWAPTFAFIDPNGTDVKWTTLEQLARFRVRSNNKVELWMLFPAGLLMRNLPKSKDPRPKDVEELTEAYGSDQWQVIYEMYRAGTLDGSSAREEYVNLLRWRLENVLGYTYTHQFDVRNEAGSSIYHLVFATCNGVGNKIMSHLYGRAAREFPAMRAEAQRLRQEHRDAEHGKVALFDSSHFETNRVSDEDLYEHRPPWPPPGTQEA
jgi:three-Cys-motif partner protein